MLSFVISTYGRSEEIKRLIISIEKTFPIDFYEIVVVSSDEPSSEKIKWIESRPNTKVILQDIRINKRLQSLYYYENIGIKNCSHEYILTLNDDMVFNDNNFYKTINTLLEYDIMFIKTQTGMYSLGRRLPIIGELKTPLDKEVRPLYLSDFVVCKKTVYDKINYLDEKLDWYGKGLDFTMCVDFVHTNFKISYINDLYMDHTISDVNRIDLSCRNDFIYLKNKWNLFCQENNGYYWKCPGISDLN